MYLFFYILFFSGLCIFLKVYFCFHILWVSIFFEWGVGVGLMPLFKCIYLFFYTSFSLGLCIFLKVYFFLIYFGFLFFEWGVGVG